MQKISDEYMLFRDGIAHKFPGYTLDKKMLIVNESDVDVDLDELKELLLSKDLEYYRTNKEKLFGNQTRFLNKKPIKNITYASYPRSGNTFLRKYFESITGIATGSDMVMKFSLNIAL